MKHFKVLGSRCKNCLATADLIKRKAAELGIEATVEKETDMSRIMGYGVMSTPGVVLDGKVIHAGGVPSLGTITQWLTG
uniref:Small redox-active disulfide protein 2 n=1 Tax=Candidatus Kentrum sp. SD TaxID=2126332 RepID=A0A451BNX8_9GAMM|nr:MAG: small redox-active disulfide protein 2 [Candidatus Kentron sp. SD]VFK46216.1 MAG: small redox-active disulfide protein 2 [Candidatus Kentron sp. SD]VFK79963.1 MAG: small redox-active disulfide protein 2 [Candidatus Kentron sp. SD]